MSAAAVSLAVPAIGASSDYLLVIDGNKGEAPVSAKISSWSFGATQTSTAPMSGKRTTKPNLGSSGQDGATQQESHSASADARKNGAVVAADFNRRAVAGDLDGDGVLDFAEAGKLDQTAPLNVRIPSNSDVAKVLCTSTHLRNGHIQGGDGAVYDLSSITAVCTGDDGSTVNVAMTGSMKHKEYTGHVTLMK
ncbi:MAG TPA: hypothetical protein VF418_02555 [Sphingomonadaceae bacterium]